MMRKTLVDYEVFVEGSSEGLPIPANFRIRIMGALVRGTDTGYVLDVELYTYKDATSTTTVTNDAFPTAPTSFELGASKPTAGISTLVKNNMDPLMDSLYGAGNWTNNPS